MGHAVVPVLAMVSICLARVSSPHGKRDIPTLVDTRCGHFRFRAGRSFARVHTSMTPLVRITQQRFITSCEHFQRVLSSRLRLGMRVRLTPRLADISLVTLGYLLLATGARFDSLMLLLPKKIRRQIVYLRRMRPSVVVPPRLIPVSSMWERLVASGPRRVTGTSTQTIVRAGFVTMLPQAHEGRAR